ncbi:hypothetical protein ACYVOU_002370 [Vibrio cholerae]
MKMLFISTLFIVSASSAVANSSVENFAKDFAADSLSYVTDSTLADNGDTKVNVVVAGVKCEVIVAKQNPEATYPQRLLVSSLYCKPTEQGNLHEIIHRY